MNSVSTVTYSASASGLQNAANSSVVVISFISDVLLTPQAAAAKADRVKGPIPLTWPLIPCLLPGLKTRKIGHVFSLQNPYVRPIAPRACRPAGPPVGLGPAQARPRQPAVHRPARSLWRDPGGGGRLQSGLQDCRVCAGGERDHGERQGGGARGGHREPSSR